MIRFYPDKHYYENIDTASTIQWLSASKFCSLFKDKFDPVETSLSSTKSKKSKWYGIPPEEIQRIWKEENARSIKLGNWYHDKQERLLLSSPTYTFKGVELPVISPIWDNGVKIAPNQKLQDGVYPEHLTYIASAGTCGQFDKPIIKDSKLYMRDYKTNKNLKEPAYVNWKGETKKLNPPLRHLDDTHLTDYALQLSLGAYMISRHNPQITVEELTIEYVTFELEGLDKYGYPLVRYDENGEPIIKDIEDVHVPYMKREVEIGISYIKENNHVRLSRAI